MRGNRGAGTLRLGHQGTFVALALLTQGGAALAQASAGPITTKVSTTPRGDSTGVTSEYVVVRRSPRIDSLAQRLNMLPIGSPEYLATDDSLRTAIRVLSRPSRPSGQSTFSIQVSPLRATLRFNILDNIPQGWFGFVADGINRPTEEPTGSYVQYFEYPTVVAVESNSPASKAGVRSGDSLVAYNGVDLLRAPINLTRLLMPGREVSVKLRRDGEAKDVVIAVEKAPPAIMSERRAAAVAQSMASMPREKLVVDSFDRRLVETRAAAAVAAGGGGGTSVASAATKPTMVSGVYAPRAMAQSVPAQIGVLGAAMTNVDLAMAESIVGMKGKRGVFVTGVPLGSLAERTGIKPFDVILRVEDSDVMNTSHLRLRLQQAEANRIEKIRMVILRAGKTLELSYEPNR
jgi:S1-C subfamily serine protease